MGIVSSSFRFTSVVRDCTAFPPKEGSYVRLVVQRPIRGPSMAGDLALTQTMLVRPQPPEPRKVPPSGRRAVLKTVMAGESPGVQLLNFPPWWANPNGAGLGCDPSVRGFDSPRSPLEARTLVLVECENCGREYEPTQTRWICPHCKWKSTCCEGEPQHEKIEEEDDEES